MYLRCYLHPPTASHNQTLHLQVFKGADASSELDQLQLLEKGLLQLHSQVQHIVARATAHQKQQLQARMLSQPTEDRSPSLFYTLPGATDFLSPLKPGSGGTCIPDSHSHNPRELVSAAELEGLKHFAKTFKLRRIELGYRQVDVIRAMGKLSGTNFSQSTISRFESLGYSFKKMLKIKLLLQKWLDDVDPSLGRESMGAGAAPAEVVLLRYQKRTTIAHDMRVELEKAFLHNPKHSRKEIAALATTLCMEKEVVRVWFCNRRQKQKCLVAPAVTGTAPLGLLSPRGPHGTLGPHGHPAHSLQPVELLSSHGPHGPPGVQEYHIHQQEPLRLLSARGPQDSLCPPSSQPHIAHQQKPLGLLSPDYSQGALSPPDLLGFSGLLPHNAHQQQLLGLLSPHSPNGEHGPHGHHDALGPHGPNSRTAHQQQLLELLSPHSPNGEHGPHGHHDALGPHGHNSRTAHQQQLLELLSANIDAGADCALAQLQKLLLSGHGSLLLPSQMHATVQTVHQLQQLSQPAEGWSSSRIRAPPAAAAFLIPHTLGSGRSPHFHSHSYGSEPPHLYAHAVAHTPLHAHAHKQRASYSAYVKGLENFTKTFKQRRIKLGFSQSHVGRALGKLCCKKFAQSTISRFESHNLSFKYMRILEPLLQKWLKEVDPSLASGCGAEDAGPSGGVLTDSLGRRRTSIASGVRVALEKAFLRNPKPHIEEIAALANELCMEKRVVCVWFCNRRRKEKRNNTPAADGSAPLRLLSPEGAFGPHLNPAHQQQTLGLQSPFGSHRVFGLHPHPAHQRQSLGLQSPFGLRGALGPYPHPAHQRPPLGLQLPFGSHSSQPHHAHQQQPLALLTRQPPRD